jgi:hypothetical protein
LAELPHKRDIRNLRTPVTLSARPSRLECDRAPDPAISIVLG